MHVLITGAYGNIGKAVIEEVRKRNHDITVFEKAGKRNTRAARKYRGIVRETIFGDITDYESIKAAVWGVDAVIHLAAVIPPLSNNRELCYAVNVGGTANLARAIVETGNRAVLIHSSSCSVMGPTQHLEPPVKVSWTPKATDNYTESKLESEKTVRESGVASYCITRLGAVMPSKGVWTMKTIKYAFEIGYNSRIEMILDSDVGLAQITAAEKLRLNLINNQETYFLGGGEKCRLKYGDFMNGLLRAIGIPEISGDKFTEKMSFLDWLDTKKAQSDLQFQRYSYSDYVNIFRKNMKKYIPLTKVFGRFVRWFIGMMSPYGGALGNRQR